MHTKWRLRVHHFRREIGLLVEGCWSQAVGQFTVNIGSNIAKVPVLCPAIGVPWETVKCNRISSLPQTATIHQLCFLPLENVYNEVLGTKRKAAITPNLGFSSPVGPWRTPPAALSLNKVLQQMALFCAYHRVVLG